MPQSPNPWLIYPQPNPQASLRLFCFHAAGTSASLFRSWVKYLPPQMELCTVQLPGRENRLREKPLTAMPPTVEILGKKLLPHLQELPFALFGHSFGSILAFEFARQLRRQNLPNPVYLFVSGRQPPHFPIRYPLHQKSNQDLLGCLEQYGGTPEVILKSPALIQLFLPIFRADLTMLETNVYIDEAPFDFPLAAFKSTDDSFVTEEELRQWSKHTNSSFDYQIFPGSHMFLKENPEPLINTIVNLLGL